MNEKAIKELVEAVEENNEINDASWTDWKDAQDIAEAYSVAIDDDEAELLQRAIETDGASLATDLEDREGNLGAEFLRQLV